MPFPLSATSLPELAALPGKERKELARSHSNAALSTFHVRLAIQLAILVQTIGIAPAFPPLWTPLAIAIEITLLAVPYYFWRSTVRRLLRADLGLCAACGYDLRGSAERCPECGLPKGSTHIIKPAEANNAARHKRGRIILGVSFAVLLLLSLLNQSFHVISWIGLLFLASISLQVLAISADLFDRFFAARPHSAST
jgi:hypothetical protein